MRLPSWNILRLLRHLAGSPFWNACFFLHINMQILDKILANFMQKLDFIYSAKVEVSGIIELSIKLKLFTPLRTTYPAAIFKYPSYLLICVHILDSVFSARILVSLREAVQALCYMHGHFLDCSRCCWYTLAWNFLFRLDVNSRKQFRTGTKRLFFKF
jgi:hypothetical protein